MSPVLIFRLLTANAKADMQRLAQEHSNDMARRDRFAKRAKQGARAENVAYAHSSKAMKSRPRRVVPEDSNLTHLCLTHRRWREGATGDTKAASAVKHLGDRACSELEPIANPHIVPSVSAEQLRAEYDGRPSSWTRFTKRYNLCL